jgi:hypothetical protein
MSMIQTDGSRTNENFDPRNANPALQAKNYQFGCQTFGRTPGGRPSSVHALMPGDIEVVAAMGDSLTAANGAKAKTVLGVALENRGVSWSIGGENCDITKLVTLPSIT